MLLSHFLKKDCVAPALPFPLLIIFDIVLQHQKVHPTCELFHTNNWIGTYTEK